MGNIPEGAQDEVEKLSMNLAMSINGWLSSTNKSDEFKMGVVMSTFGYRRVRMVNLRIS